MKTPRKKPTLTPEQTAERRTESQKQLRLAYGRVFETPDGKAILEDLQARYGWKGGIELPSYTPQATAESAIHRDGMKEPVRHILRMVNAGQPKPEEA